MRKKIGIGVGIVSIITILFIVVLSMQKITFHEYKTEDYKITYDSTWKIKSQDSFMLKHKKSGSTLSIQSKVLEDYLIDTDLKDLLPEIVASIEKQNEGFSLIDVDENIHEKYQGVSYLYEKEEEQVLIEVFKKDTKLVVLYYVATSDSFDIVFDSVESIINSLEIISNEN